jgi:outer membrane receptor protein involved in Fe transport
LKKISLIIEEFKMKTSYWFMPQVVCLTVVVPVAALSGMATAQETNEASSGKTRQVLEEVVVTAQKRSENLTDVPLSVSVLGGDEIREKALRI